MSEPVLRPARRADIEIIAGYNAAMAFETEARTLDPDRLRAGVAAVFDDPARGFYRVAEIGGKVVACLLVTFEWSDWRNGQWWWLQSVYVHPDHRGQRLFGRLYRQLREDAQATAGVCGLRLYVEHDNSAAQAVYAALGMQPEPYRILHEAFNESSAPEFGRPGSRPL